MNQLPMRIYIADPGSSEMRLGLAGDVVPEYRKETVRVFQQKPDPLDPGQGGNSHFKKSHAKSPSREPGMFMHDQYTQFLNQHIKDSVTGLVVLEKNQQ